MDYTCQYYIRQRVKFDHFGYFKSQIVPSVSLGCPVVHGGYLEGKIGPLHKTKKKLPKHTLCLWNVTCSTQPQTIWGRLEFKNWERSIWVRNIIIEILSAALKIPHNFLNWKIKYWVMDLIVPPSNHPEALAQWTNNKPIFTLKVTKVVKKYPSG